MSDFDTYIIVQGSPIKGQSFHGPFDDPQEGMMFAYANWGDAGDWWVAALQPPDNNDEEAICNSCGVAMNCDDCIARAVAGQSVRQITEANLNKVIELPKQVEMRLSKL